MAINHLHLRVRDVGRARRFYEGYFGLRDWAVHDDGVVFLRDDAGLDLALAPADTVEPLPDWFHFGARQASAVAVEALYARMQAEGVRITEALTREGDLIYFRCADPDGYQLEVYWEPQHVSTSPPNPALAPPVA